MYTSHALTTGFLLQGSKYKISKVLGNGGFGITYLATHNFLEKQVAIKEVYSSTFCKRNNDGSLTGLSDDFEVFKRNFFAEARTLAKFSNNKNIVQVSDIFNENNTIYFVMDYVEGHSLQEFIAKKGILPFSQAIKYTIDILTALIEVHQNSILHRDIKPANLLIRNTDKEIILIDFGIAREFTQDETLTQTAIGSVGYAPPEQSVLSYKRTASVDLYSVGAVLYFCLTGKRPQTNDERSIEDYISAKQLNSAIPKNLDGLITKAIQQRPNERFQSAEEMIKSLKGLSEGNVIKAKEVQNVVNKEKLVVEEKSKGNKVIKADNFVEPINKPSKSFFSLTKLSIQKGFSNFLYLCAIIVFVFSVYEYIQSKSIQDDFDQARNYHKGINGIEQDYKKAIELYHKLALSDNISSQINLGFMYYHGQSTVQDYDKAFMWFSKAAEQGSSDAQYNLGLMYRKGLGVEQNDYKAIELFHKAAKQNYSNAQVELGYMYEKGLGTEQNRFKAIEWYREAAKQGNATARNNLEILGESYP